MIEAAMATPSSYSKGGIVRKTGLAKVHKGEKVISKRSNRLSNRSSNSRRSSRR